MRAHGSIAALALVASVAGAQPAKRGVRAPEIDLPALAGGRVKLSTLRGHPVVVSYWNSWCPPCRTEFPELVRVQKLYDSVGLRVLGVNGYNQELGPKPVQQFVDEFSVSFPIALDKRGLSRRALNIVFLPTTDFIDSAGIIQHVQLGGMTREDLERGLASILPRP